MTRSTSMRTEVDAGSTVARTERLRLRCLDRSDAAFIRRLVNEPSWIRFIGDRNVHTLDDARRYLDDGPLAMYARHGFGLWLVSLGETGDAMGLCGLIKRDALDDVDLGFAFLPAYWGRGYALEASQATLGLARDAHGLARVVAVVSRDNARSTRLLVRLGFRFEGQVRLRAGDDPIDLYGTLLRERQG